MANTPTVPGTHPVMKVLLSMAAAMLVNFAGQAQAASDSAAVSVPAEDGSGATSTNASTNASEQAAESKIRIVMAARLKSKGLHVDGVSKSPYFNLYEVRVGNELLYTDEKLSYIFNGRVLDGRTLENLTEERINKLTAVNFTDLPLKDAIKMVNGTGARQIAYFTDPNCPYCKQLEQTLTHLKDATVYVFLYPILSEDSVVKAKALWCASDRAGAWNDWMLRGKMVSTPGTCETPLASNHALAEKLNVRATPTLVLGNGQRIAGALAEADLEQAIADAGK